MLADLLPLMIDTVQHRRGALRDVFGRIDAVQHTNHRARVTYSPGQAFGAASRQSVSDAAATVWLIDHPHPVAIGDTFELPDASVLKVMRCERRPVPGGSISKVYLT